ncbi:protein DETOXIFICATION 16-like [Ananas comosus]|uniref:Protein DETOXIFICATION n=1 Tax=Ananas comosus TaxID=4615 RepID=A0A6P5FTQ6_ANACO|nr:protein DETOXIFICATION 16-like [Ananas comosus]
MGEGEEENPSPHSPLLPSSSSSSSEQNPNPPISIAVADEVPRQLGLAAPLIAVSLLQYLLQVISVMVVGHLGELALSGASVAASFANVTGFSVLLGMGTALDTLCGQAYGAKQYHILGIQMQRAMFVLLLASVPLAFIWANTSQILIAVGQNPEISKEAGLYARWLIPGLFAYGLLQCHVRFLQTQNIIFPMVISSGVTALLHLILCWILVYKSGLGTKGAALATTISYWINTLILALYIKLSRACRRTWTGFSTEALSDVLNFLRLAVPSAFMTCLEYWAFEMVVLLAGFLPNPKLETSVLSISLNTMWVVYTIPTGLSNAASIRVSNELGAGHPQAARLSVYVVVAIAITEGLIVALATILVRDIWGYLYSNEEEVVKYVSAMMPILAASDFMDGIQCTLSGAARGCGWQKICSVINLGAYYVVGIPSAVLFAFFFHAGGKGLWMGIICAMIVQILVLIAMILSTNWDQEVRKARESVQTSDANTDPMIQS